MRYWNGHRWVDRCGSCERSIERYPHVCGPYLVEPFTVTAAELAHARANPLNLNERMMNVERDEDLDDQYAGAVLGFHAPACSVPLSQMSDDEIRALNGRPTDDELRAIGHDARRCAECGDPLYPWERDATCGKHGGRWT